MILWLLLNLLFSPIGVAHQQVNVDDFTTIDRLAYSNISEMTQLQSSEVPGSKPIVEWLTERDHDFQHLRQAHPKSFVFRFKNIDTEPVVLQTVRTTCGCTAATWIEAPIAPGEIGEIVVEYDAYKLGEFKKKIKVFFDRQRKPEILWIHGEVD
ncbi:MAG: DUF1573 domain-containing protein [Saprospiraceae bacterium]